MIYFHLPGLFEFYDFYKVFLPLFYENREYFYDNCEIGSIYGAPGSALWGGGRTGFGDTEPKEVKALCDRFNISARLTFSNSLLRPEHLGDPECNRLCALFVKLKQAKANTIEKSFLTGAFDGAKSSSLDAKHNKWAGTRNGIIIYSDLLLDYIKKKYPNFYFVSSTTKCITDFDKFKKELNRVEFDYVVPDYRLNKSFEKLEVLTQEEKDKTEFLINECCSINCTERAACYEDVSRKSLGISGNDHICHNDPSGEGYVFSKAMRNPMFISREDIFNVYAPMGFSIFKIEGRSLGSALLLEFILYYMTKPEFHINVREKIYLDNELDLF